MRPKRLSNARTTGKFILSFALLYAIALFIFDFGPKAPEPFKPPTLTQDGIIHILYGDETGGGHRYGANIPCKSEFPKNWSDEKIIETVEAIASNDNQDWNKQDNGYFVTEKTQENLKIRIVINSDKTRIITAYPTNVTRNPCPANDN